MSESNKPARRVEIDGATYKPLRNGDQYLEPRSYVAANIRALLKALAPLPGFNNGDWFYQLIYWAEANGADEGTPNADYAELIERVRKGGTQ